MNQLDGRIGELARNIRDHKPLNDGQATFNLAFARMVEATGSIAAVLPAAGS
jgi:hypothetical protein